MAKVKSSIHIFAGAPGSGKTFLATNGAYWHLFFETIKWMIHHYSPWRIWPWKKREDERPPDLFSTLPVKYPLFCRIWHHQRWCHKLTREIILGVERIPRGSQIVWDEIGGSAHQYLYKHGVEKLRGLDDFARFCRQYTYGEIWATDQSPDNITYHYTRRSGDTFVLNNFHLFPLFGFASGVNIMTIVDVAPSDISKNTNDGIAEKLLFDKSFRIFFRPILPIYDSHIFYRRYIKRAAHNPVNFKDKRDISGYQLDLDTKINEIDLYK